jgi:hypothetical protein
MFPTLLQHCKENVTDEDRLLEIKDDLQLHLIAFVSQFKLLLSGERALKF